MEIRRKKEVEGKKTTKEISSIQFQQFHIFLKCLVTDKKLEWDHIDQTVHFMKQYCISLMNLLSIRSCKISLNIY